MPEKLDFLNLEINQKIENERLQRFLKYKRQFHIELEIAKLKTARPSFYRFNDSNLDSY